MYQSILFAILLFTYKALHGLAPSYLNDLLTIYTPVGNLRSSSHHPFSRLKTYGDRAFSVCAPKLTRTPKQRLFVCLFFFSRQQESAETPSHVEQLAGILRGESLRGE